MTVSVASRSVRSRGLERRDCGRSFYHKVRRDETNTTKGRCSETGSSSFGQFHKSSSTERIVLSYYTLPEPPRQTFTPSKSLTYYFTKILIQGVP